MIRSTLALAGCLLLALALPGTPCRADTPAAPQTAAATLQVMQVPPDARVFLNGAEKGSGSQSFTPLEAGSYELRVRRTGFHEFTQAVTLAPGQTLKVVPKFDPLRVAIFPIQRTGTWSSTEPEAYTAGWVTRALKKALDQAKLIAAYSMHTDDRRMRSAVGDDLDGQPDVSSNAWNVFGNANIDLAMKTGRALDVDAVLFLSVTRDADAKTGDWKAKLVDVRNTTITDDSGSFPLGYRASAAITSGIGPLLQRYVESAR